MDINEISQKTENIWILPPKGKMRVAGVIYSSTPLMHEMDLKALEQVANVASLPGIVTASYAMPDTHWGYGFPIGGVAAFDPDEGGVVSAGGVGFDISCGVRTMLTGISLEELQPLKKKLADILFNTIPAGIGSTGKIRLERREMEAMLAEGARWAVRRGYGSVKDLERIEHHGKMDGAQPDAISEQARKRQRDQMGTLGSGNHYVEVQLVEEIYDEQVAGLFGLRKGEIVVSLHCGSRGLGHQVATEFSKKMAVAAASHGIELPDRELACAPIKSDVGQAYLGAMRCAANCALANRQILTHLVRETFSTLFGKSELPLLYDVSHNICNMEEHLIDGKPRTLFVHRKGATRALGPDHPGLPPDLKQTGQPVLIGGTMGTSSYVLVGTNENATLSFNSACHGAGRRLSRTKAMKQWHGQSVIKNLALKDILIHGASLRGIAEEAPGAYKDVDQVVDVTVKAGLARKIARVKPLICIKG